MSLNSRVINIFDIRWLYHDIKYIDLTSLENSIGRIFYKWNDGSHLSYTIQKDSIRVILIKPEKYVYMSHTCHEDSYYECIASELDKMDFNQTSCTKKCIPEFFCRGKNYSTPFCQNEDENYCAYMIALEMIENNENDFTKNAGLRCNHSCKILQYSGEEVFERIEKSEELDETRNHFTLAYAFVLGENAPPHQVPKFSKTIFWKKISGKVKIHIFLPTFYNLLELFVEKKILK